MNFTRKYLTLFLLLLSPLLAYSSEFQVKVIQGEDDLPEKFSRSWKKGDFLASDGEYLILIGGSSRTLQSILNYPAGDALGSILSFGPLANLVEADLIIGPPQVKIDGRRKYVSYSSLKPLPSSADGVLIFQASASYLDQRGEAAEILTTYRFLPGKGRMEITSSFKNTGKAEFEELEYSLYFSAGTRYSFTPYNKERHPDLHFSIFPKKGHALGWMSLDTLPSAEEEILPGKLAPGESYEVHYLALTNPKLSDLLDSFYELRKIVPERATLNFLDFDGSLLEVIVRDALSQAVFFRSFLKSPHSVEVSLPEGFYTVRANFFPAVVERALEVRKDEDNLLSLRDLPKGKVKVSIKNRNGEHVPGKVTFIGLDPAKSPYFKPEDPVQSGRGWETFKNSCYPRQQGLELEVPAGTYLIYASRGPEYTLDYRVEEILSDKPQELSFQIEKVVDTGDYISLDPHMHTHFSDGTVKTPERIRSVIAEGVDVAVSTEHNYLNDYLPTLKKLGLEKDLAVITGNEVTTGDVIHYNTYPLAFQKDEENNGAINPLSEEVTPLFEASRAKDPGAILQVNHPRAGTIGYFNNYQLDEGSAATARTNFDTSFDVLEVMNGAFPYPSNSAVINDWLNLLNRGYYYPIVGSSDSHTIDRGEPGYCRTYILYRGEKHDKLNPKALVQALKEGRSFVSNGPFVEFKVNGRHTHGDILTAPQGKVSIWVRVQAAAWVSVDEVRLIINGERRIVFNVKTGKDSLVRFSEEIGLTLPKDASVAVEVLGKSSLFPVMQALSRSRTWEDAALPYALTNPVFVDVDGNGRFDPPLPEKIKLVSEVSDWKPVSRR